MGAHGRSRNGFLIFVGWIFLLSSFFHSVVAWRVLPALHKTRWGSPCHSLMSPRDSGTTLPLTTPKALFRSSMRKRMDLSLHMSPLGRQRTGYQLQGTGETLQQPKPWSGVTGSSRSTMKGRRSSSLHISSLMVPASLLQNQWYIWSVLMASASLGISAERTKTGAALSGPLTTMLITLILCNLKLLPASSTTYDMINKVFVQMAVPLLLFDADMKRVIKYSGTLLSCFALGSIGTILGTLVAYRFVPMGLGAEGWKVASALAARHIGGAVNYVAVAETFKMSSNAVVASLAADNLVVAVYFIFLFWITKSSNSATTTAGTAEAASETTEAGELEKKVSASDLTNEKFGLALTVSMAICGLGELIASRVFKGSISSIPIATLITVVAATLMPVKLGGSLGIAGSQIGLLFMQLFFAATGACGDIGMVMSTAPLVLVFSAVQLIVHFAFLVGAGRLLRLPFRELVLASNANVGGPTTAAGMAAAKGWKLLMLPALLTGILGYAVGTFIGVGLGQGVLQGMLVR